MFPIARRTLLVAAGLLAARPLLRSAIAAEIDPTGRLAYPYSVPPLTYDVGANEPAIDAMTMQIHHDKHHGAYVKNLNDALKGHPELQQRSLSDILAKLGDVPEDIRTTVRNNGGGHSNHTMFWKIMGPANTTGIGGAPSGPLADQIKADFGDFDAFKKVFNETTAKQFGSGWGWLVLQGGKLKVITTANQDSPLSQGIYPILGNDVWEHAYYLKYQNRRNEYLDAWWNTLDWDAINANYEAAKK